VTDQGAPGRRPGDRVPPGMKLELGLSANAADDDLQFALQLGLEYVQVTGPGRGAPELNGAAPGTFLPDYDYLARVRERFDAAGLRIYNWGNWRSDSIILGLPDRDAVIAGYCEMLRALARVGIPCTTYAHWSVIPELFRTAAEPIRGGARAAAFDAANAAPAVAHLRYGREFSEDEIWDNYAYFVERAAPAAAAAGVLIAMHPDDPPLPRVAGVPRCIFSSFAGYQRALEIADSPNVGVCLCTGCWLEGGERMGATLLEAIDAFGRQGKLFHIHFRNVSAALPHFVETYVDAGYMDMYAVVRALRRVGYRGGVAPEHTPEMVGQRRVGTAYTYGYVKALIERANAEPAAP
jgi:mannonate dehydratase